MPGLFLHPTVFEDIQKTVDYYDTINPLLSGAFLDEIEACFEGIQGIPEGYQKRLGEILITFLKRFSFGVSYKLTLDM